MRNDLKEKIEQSLCAMRENIPVKDFSETYPLVVNFSGGKDSLACLLLARMLTDHVECNYYDSGFELPNTLSYVKERCKELDVPLNISHPLTHKIKRKESSPLYGCHKLEDYIRHYKYFPSSHCRWCSIYCKQRPASIMIREKWGEQKIYKLVGVKIADSKRRKYVYGSKEAAEKYGGYWTRPDKQVNGTVMAFPLLNWENQDCIDFVNESGIELHSGYKVFGKSGCFWCPVHKPEFIKAVSEAYPGIYDSLIEAERDINSPAWKSKDLWLRDVVGDS